VATGPPHKINWLQRNNTMDSRFCKSINDALYPDTGGYATHQEAMREITEYIEVFYNRQRRQRKLGYLTPAGYERRYYEKHLAA